MYKIAGTVGGAPRQSIYRAVQVHIGLWGLENKYFLNKIFAFQAEICILRPTWVMAP